MDKTMITVHKQSDPPVRKYLSRRFVKKHYFAPLTNIKEMSKTKITVNSNGSLKVEGDFEIVDKTGAGYDLGGREIISICRCGLSKNKPFCDGSHKGHFEHDAVAFSLPPKK